MSRRRINWRHVGNELALLCTAALMTFGAWAIAVFLLAAEVPQ